MPVAQPITKDWAKWLGVETFNDPAISLMVDRCAAFSLAFKSKQHPRWLTLLGNSGTGKTHCAGRAWTYLKKNIIWDKNDYTPGKIYWPEFVSDLRSGNAFEKLRDMVSWPALFLDDIGAERDTTGFASEQLNMLLGRRMDKWTILTSNLSLENLGQIDPRIADRVIRPPNIFCDIETKSYAVRKFTQTTI